MEPCGFTLSGVSCTEVGDHFCERRAQHIKLFIETALVHTKGKYFRQPFRLKDWQFDEIVAPLFGTAEFSQEHQCYRRRYRIAWIEIARKNGKSELLAAMMLYILFCDGEASAELTSVATDRKQAGAVFDVALQMILLSPKLAQMIKPIPSQKRIVKKNSNSIYQVLANDGGAALGSNPSAVAADEVLAWPNGGMWHALRSGMGSMARTQPLFMAATTAGNDSESFGGQEHTEMVRVAGEPERAPHIFTYIRNTPMDADPFDEDNWHYANPALGDFLSLESMREMALEARNNPAKLNAFRQFQLNQWVNAAIAWMPMHMWDESAGTLYRNAKSTIEAFDGRECWFGLDLAATQDLTSMCYLFPGEAGVDVLWRHWICEAGLAKLDDHNSGRFTQWAEAGWLTVTEGDVLDYERVYADVAADSRRFTILGGDADKWAAPAVIQRIEDETYINEIFAYSNDFTHMSPGMHKLFDLVTEKRFFHHGNPVARFCFDACDARVAKYDPDLIRPDKPNRTTAAKRIDAVPAAIMAVNAWHTRGGDHFSIYAGDSDVLVL